MTRIDRPLRLGFPVKVMGKPGLKSQDTRRWQKNPHLKCSLELLDVVLDYLKAERLDMYRLSSDIAPYATHPDMPQFHNMVAESDAELRAFGDLELVEATLLGGDDLMATNTREAPDRVVPVAHPSGSLDGTVLRAELPPASWSMFRLRAAR